MSRSLDPQSLRSRFIVFDGPDGSGKSTQFARFATWCVEHGVNVCQVREPGGTSIGEQIRTILLDPANTDISLRCEMLLYMASRAHLVETVITPALDRHELVLADRFISSTLAYQGAASGLRIDDILAVARVAVGPVWPDLTIIFDVDEQTAAQRLSRDLDRMELKGQAFHRRVRQGYLDQAERTPGSYAVINAADDPDTVFNALLDTLAQRLH